MYTANELRKHGVYVRGITTPRTKIIKSTRNGQVIVYSKIRTNWISI